MRIFLSIISCMFIITLHGQTNVPPTFMGNNSFGGIYQYNPLLDTASLNKKWSLNKFGGLSTGFGFSRGGSSSFISAPIGLQLNRRLSKNLYAFAAVSTAPSYLTFNHSFNDFNAYKSNSGNNRFKTNGFANYSRAEAGLMYINDEKTFSISGSVGVSSGYYQNFPQTRVPTQQPINMSR